MQVESGMPLVFVGSHTFVFVVSMLVTGLMTVGLLPFRVSFSLLSPGILAVSVIRRTSEQTESGCRSWPQGVPCHARRIDIMGDGPHTCPTRLVDARNIGVRRNKRRIIPQVDIQVTRGELVYLIGANGAGQSTCVKALLGLIRIDEGEIEQAPGLEVGYVPQRLSVSSTRRQVPLSS